MAKLQMVHGNSAVVSCQLKARPAVSKLAIGSQFLASRTGLQLPKDFAQTNF